MESIDVGTIPGVAMLTYMIIELFAKNLASNWKPPLAGVLGVALSLASWAALGAFGDPLTAAMAGIVGAATSMGIHEGYEHYRRKAE